MDISGNQLTKRKDSQTVGSIIFPVISQSKVVNLVPPRELWPQSQGIRNQHLPNQRCGPHFSFVEPFITEEQFPRVVELLTPVLAEVSHIFHLKIASNSSFDSDPNKKTTNGQKERRE